MGVAHVSASFSTILRVRLPDAAGSFARVATVIGEQGASLGSIDLVRVERGHKIRDVTILAEDEAHVERVVAAVNAVEGVEVQAVSDRTFLIHLGGKLEMHSRVPLKTRDDLSMAYTPGVARVSRAIARRPGRDLEPDDQAQHGGGGVRWHAPCSGSATSARAARCR